MFINIHKLRPVFLIFLLFVVACDDNSNDNEFICSFEEMQERFANTDCIAEELVFGCINKSCGATDDGNPSIGNFDDCNVIDCATLECENIQDSSENPVIFVPGTLTELAISEINGLPLGNFVIDETESPFDCLFIAVD